MAFNYITAEEAAALIKDGDSIGSSGFTAPGSPKFISQALAAKAEKEHAEGRPFKVNIFTGASTSDKYDGMLARANAINMRAPYQNLPDLRKRINAHDAHYFDRHLSEMAQEMRYGFYGKLDWAIIEAAHVSPDGEIVLGCGCGNVATYAALADRMMAYAEKRLTEHGFEPYYLYRQSRMAGNLENTGWAKPGFACAYNIFTMDETETVLACGAGGVTKLKDPYSEDLTRIFNFKYSYEYISRYGEILERKEGIGRQYEQFRKRIH